MFSRRGLHRGLHRLGSAGSSGPIGPVTLQLIETRREDLFLRYLDSAPLDDEPVTSEEAAAVAEVEADRAAGLPTVTFDELKLRYSPP
jgi:hypothetical protein